MSSRTRSHSLTHPRSQLDSGILVFECPVTAEEIFKQVVKAVKTGKLDMLLFNDVDPEDFAQALESLRYPSNHLEGYSFRIHWFSSANRLKVVMPSHLHECIGSWLVKNMMQVAAKGLISDVWIYTMTMMAAPEYKNFVGKHVGSVKEADFAFIPHIGPQKQQSPAYPSVVLESGWYESSTRLLEDSRVWQEGSAGEVRVVLQAKFYEADQQNKIRLDFSISRAAPGGGPILQDDYPIFPAPSQLQNNPTISLDEFYSGNCPPTIDPATAIPLDLARLRQEADFWIRKQGYLPAGMS